MQGVLQKKGKSGHILQEVTNNLFPQSTEKFQYNKKNGFF